MFRKPAGYTITRTDSRTAGGRKRRHTYDLAIEVRSFSSYWIGHLYLAIADVLDQHEPDQRIWHVDVTLASLGTRALATFRLPGKEFMAMAKDGLEEMASALVVATCNKTGEPLPDNARQRLKDDGKDPKPDSSPRHSTYPPSEMLLPYMAVDLGADPMAHIRDPHGDEVRAKLAEAMASATKPTGPYVWPRSDPPDPALKSAMAAGVRITANISHIAKALGSIGTVATEFQQALADYMKAMAKKNGSP